MAAAPPRPSSAEIPPRHERVDLAGTTTTGPPRRVHGVPDLGPDSGLGPAPRGRGTLRRLDAALPRAARAPGSRARLARLARALPRPRRRALAVSSGGPRLRAGRAPRVGPQSPPRPRPMADLDARDKRRAAPRAPRETRARGDDKTRRRSRFPRVAPRRAFASPPRIAAAPRRRAFPGPAPSESVGRLGRDRTFVSTPRRPLDSLSTTHGRARPRARLAPVGRVGS